jgi:hypothetical protein
MKKHYRSLKLLFLFILVGVTWISCKDKVGQNPVLESKEATPVLEEGWVSLFDGTNLNAWRTYLKDSVTGEWEIREGALVYRPHPDSAHGMNNLITRKKYRSFELALEWKIEKDGNSGVFYGIMEDEKYVVPYMTAPEVQLRDYSSNPDFSDNKQMSGAIFGIIGPERDVARPAGEWNELWMSIDRKSNLGRVVLNGVELFSYPVQGEAWRALVDGSKFKDWEGFAVEENGHIGLQDHAHEVWFRNIRIKELK